MGLLNLISVNNFLKKKSSAAAGGGVAAPGLTWTAYSGYSNDDVNFGTTFTKYPATSNSPQGYDPPSNGKNTGTSSDLTNLSTGTNGNFVGNGGDGKNHHVFAIEWVGVFYTQSYGGTWTFYTNSDDMSFLWIGDAATTGYTTANATVNCGGLHGMVQRSGTAVLTANTYYPIRIQFSENGGGYEMITTFTRPDGTSMTNGTGYYFTAKPGAGTVITNTAGLSWSLWQSYWPNFYSSYSVFPNVPMPTSGTWTDPLNGGSYDSCRGINTGTSSNLTSLNTGTNGSIIDNNGNTHHFSVKWSGYIYTKSFEGLWRWGLSSDDASSFWIGPLATSGATPSNSMAGQSIYLNAYTFYPILIWYGEYGGGFSCNVTAYKPDGTTFTDGTDYYYSTNNALTSYTTGSSGLAWSLWQSYWPNFYASYSVFPNVRMPTSGTWSDPLNGGTWDSCRGVNTGTANNLGTLNTGTNGSIIDNNGNTHHFSTLWTGYVYTQSYGGNWYWTTSSDDASSVWVGALALSGATSGNANGGTSIYLPPYSYLPIRIWYGEYEGGFSCNVTAHRPDGVTFTDGTGYYFSSVTVTQLSSGGSNALTDLNAVAKIWGAYSAEAWNSGTNVLPDLTGNGHNATTTGVSYVTGSGNGANATIAYLAGTTSSRMFWPAGSVPSTFTIASLTRYSGGSNGRILETVNGNWLHGHWSGQAGVCYYEGWKAVNYTGSSLNLNNWIICVGTNNTSIAMPNNIIVNGVGVANQANGGSGSYQLTVNQFEVSDFNFSQLLIWDSGLTLAQMQSVSTILQNYLNSGSSVSAQALLAGGGGTVSYPFWTPLQVTGLQLWLDANDPLNNGSPPTTGYNGTSVITTWYDKSGNGRNATSVNSPTFSYFPNPATNIIGTAGYYGGQQCAVNFSGNGSSPGVTQYLYGSIPITSNTMTVLAICTMTSSSTPVSARIIGFSNGSGTYDFNNNSYFGFLRQSNTGFGPYRNGNYINNNPSTYNTPYLWECWFDGTNQYASVCGGGQVAQQSSASSGNFAISYYALGTDTLVENNGPLGGSISEVLVFNTCLSTSDRQSLEGYMSWKWGMQSFLPTNHPYYANPPSGSSSNVDFAKSIPVVVLGTWNGVGTWTGSPGGDQTGYWVWNIGRASSNSALGPWIHFYKQITVSTAFTGTMWIICDNYSYFFMNGTQYGGNFGGNWGGNGTSVSVAIPSGTVLLDIFAINAGGPGGLIATLYNGGTVVAHTDPTWTCYATATAWSGSGLPANLI